MPGYSVLLHATNVVIMDDEYQLRRGGAYTWRCLESDTSANAARVASNSLLCEEDFLKEIWNESPEEIRVEAEEVHELDGAEKEVGDSGFVFYIEEGE